MEKQKRRSVLILSSFLILLLSQNPKKLTRPPLQIFPISIHPFPNSFFLLPRSVPHFNLKLSHRRYQFRRSSGGAAQAADMEYGSRSWMYNRNNPGQWGMRNEFAVGVQEFIEKAKTLDDFIRHGQIKCPCVKCKCNKGKNLVDVEMHLHRKGFMPNYSVWIYHGESGDTGDDVNFQNTYGDGSGPFVDNDLDNYRMNDMVNDAFGMYREEPSQPGTSQPTVEHVPSDEAKLFYKRLEEASRPLYEGSVHSKLSVAVRLLSIKSGFSISQAAMDSIIGLMNELNPTNMELPTDYYYTKKLVSTLGLSSERIHSWVEERDREEKATTTYEARMKSEASECGSTTPAPMTLEKETTLRLEVNGGVKTGTAYGLGSQYASDHLNPGLFGTYTPTTSIDPSMEAVLRNEIEELKRKSEEDRLRIEASMNATREMMQNFMCGNSYKGKRKGKGKSRGKGKIKRRYSLSSESSSEEME